MREAQSLQQATAAAPEMRGEGIISRRVGTRTFVMRDSTWTDIRSAEGLRVVKVQAYSEAYFALIRELPDVAEALALGDRVLVRGAKVAIEVAPNGAERLTAAELASVVAAW